MAAGRSFAQPGMIQDLAHYGAFDAPLALNCDFVVIDVETTGFEPSKGARVIEFGAHRTRGDGEVIESFSTLIDHGSDDTGAEFIHGISADMLHGAPTFAQVWPAIESIMSNAIVVAHNAAFDMSFMASEIALAGKSMQTMPGLCTYWLARQAFPESPNHKLSTIAESLGVINDQEHDASADAMVVVKALPFMFSKIDAVKHHIEPGDRIEMPSGIPIKNRR